VGEKVWVFGHGQEKKTALAKVDVLANGKTNE